MNTYFLIASIITLALILGYINHRFIGLQATIAMMISSLLIALTLMIIGHYDHTNPWYANITTLVDKLDFGDLLLKGMLGFLLFAGALTIDLDQLKQQKTTILTLASVSTIISTALVALASWALMYALHIPFPWLYACLFGALISPTDPIAVLATFKRIKAPKSLTACVAGESLFNDGVGIVLFLTLYQLISHPGIPSVSDTIRLFLQQAMGGLAYGYLIARLSFWLIKPLNEVNMVVLITLAITTGGYTFASTLGVSGPLAMVVCGIVLGHRLRTQKQIYPSVAMFWEIIDDILNVVLFLLLGFELLTIHFNTQWFVANLCIIPIVLLIRLVTVAIPLKLVQPKRGKKQPWMITLLTWGGLRGGLAVALALSLPDSPYRHLVLSLTYSVVVFSVIVQGLSIAPLARAASKAILNTDTAKSS